MFKRDHGSTDCWTKQHDAGGEGGKGAGLASVEDVFDITALDKDEENEWQGRFSVDAHVRAVHGYRHPPRPPEDGNGLSRGKRVRITTVPGRPSR